MTGLRRFLLAEDGVASVEYSLIAMLVALAILDGVTALGVNVRVLYERCCQQVSAGTRGLAITRMNGIASTGSWLAAGGWQFLVCAALVALLIGAAWIDVLQHRIPNILVFSGAALALLMAHLPGGSVTHCIAGIAVGMAMGLPLYWLRAMGAGDVKLMGMVGAFLGAGDMFAAALVIFVVGGVLGLVAVARQRAFGQLAVN